jgi:hypothetical protein
MGKLLIHHPQKFIKSPKKRARKDDLLRAITSLKK